MTYIPGVLARRKERELTEDKTTYGKVAYDAYLKAVGGKSYDGKPLPAYKDIKQQSVVSGWEAGARAVVLAHIENTRRLAEEVKREMNGD